MTMQQAGWEEQARLYARNAEFWRTRAEKLEAALRRMLAYVEHADLQGESFDTILAEAHAASPALAVIVGDEGP